MEEIDGILYRIEAGRWVYLDGPFESDIAHFRLRSLLGLRPIRLLDPEERSGRGLLFLPPYLRRDSEQSERMPPTSSRRWDDAQAA